MKLTLFYVSYAFLVATLVFHILGVSTNSWWKSGSERSGDKVVFVAGLWKVCLQGRIDHSCVEYMRLVDVDVNGVPMYRAIGGLSEGSRKQLNILRTCVLLFIVLLLSLLLVSTLILGFICRGSKVVFPRWLKISILLTQACSVCVGFACVIIPTKHDKIFLNSTIQLKMSWMCVLLSNFFNIFAAVTIVAMFVDDVTNNKISRQPMKFSATTKEMVHAPVVMETREKLTLRSESEMNEDLEWDELEWRIEQYSSKVPVHDQTPTIIDVAKRSGPESVGELPRPERPTQSPLIEETSVEILEFVETTMFSETTRVAETIIINEPTKCKRSAKGTKPTKLREAVTPTNVVETKKFGGPKKLIPPAGMLNEPIRLNETKLHCEPKMPGEPTMSHDSTTKLDEGRRKTRARRKVPLIADIAIFSEIDLGRLQSESFRNKSIRAKSSSFANRVPYYASITDKTRLNT